MGGVGDLLMMTPGLRALSKRQGRPVKFATKKQFFPLFENNPYVELIDIDGPARDVFKYKWHNLSFCPAAFHENRKRPFVKKGRVELFARGMSVSRRELSRHGEKIEIVLSAEDQGFRDHWIAQKFSARKPLVGIQPYSRETYRDHPRIMSIIASLAASYNVLIFHHLPLDVPSGLPIACTDGLKLRQSLSLVSALDALLAVDSGFLHAASAFNVPTVALFGPVDGKVRTAHISRVNILQTSSQFSCLPCWRNEDQPCIITNDYGTSACLAALEVDSIVDAVQQATKLI